VTDQSTAPIIQDTQLPPRTRILNAACELFYRHGLHAVGVDAIAEAADTNKMTLYRHFKSKDELIAECLRQVGKEFEADWRAVERAYPGDHKGQLLAWLQECAECKLSESERGCALANAAIELPDPNHPARRVIEQVKTLHREKICELCRKAGLADPELLADELFLLFEGARISIQSVGPKGPAARLTEMLHTLVAAHARSNA
jgi:AcrR family transcriptional regulator